jgi:hypothetical protein
MGAFVFTPPGLDERLIDAAGFADIRVHDWSENTGHVASAWHAVRERRAAEVNEVEGAEQNASTQRFSPPRQLSPANGACHVTRTSPAVASLRDRATLWARRPRRVLSRLRRCLPLCCPG